MHGGDAVPLAARTRILASTLTASLLMTVLALLPGGAGAQDTVKPTPCGGEPLITDPAGDQDPGGPNQDITGVFLNYIDGHLTANIQIANLSKELPDQADSQGGAYWYVWYTDGDTRRFVKAVNADGSTVTYAYGMVDPFALGFYLTSGDTTGKFIEGPDGIIQIEIPSDAGAGADKKFAGVVATADDITGLNDVIGVNSSVDIAPDGASSLDGSDGGKDYTVAPCVAAPTPPPVATPTTPTTTELPLKVTKVLDGAKKAKRKKALRLTVNATEAITDLSLSLKAKGATYGNAKVASLSGTKTLKLKILKPKKFKSGTYTLTAKGTVAGTKRKATLTVKVKK
jgi:hypothetical protein